MQALRRRGRRHRLDLVRAQQPLHRVALNRIIFDDQNSVHALRELRLELLENLGQVLTLHRLRGVADRAERKRRLRVVGRLKPHEPGCDGCDVALQPIEHGKAGMVRQADIEHDGARKDLPSRARAPPRRSRRRGLEVHLVREIRKDARRTSRRPRPPAGRVGCPSAARDRPRPSMPAVGGEPARAAAAYRAVAGQEAARAPPARG